MGLIPIINRNEGDCMKVIIRLALLAVMCAVLIPALSACDGEADPNNPVVYVYEVGDDFITNVKGAPTMHLRCEVIFRLTSKKAVTSFADDNDIIRDSVIKVLRELTEEDILNGDLNAIAQELVDSANEAMQTDVFYSATFPTFAASKR